MWKSKNGKVHYESFEELVPQKKKAVRDVDKKREKFLGTCKVCGQPMSWIEGTNVVCCKNADCKGVRMNKKDKEDNDITVTIPVSRTISSKSMEYAEYLFG